MDLNYESKAYSFTPMNSGELDVDQMDLGTVDSVLDPFLITKGVEIDNFSLDSPSPTNDSLPSKKASKAKVKGKKDQIATAEDEVYQRRKAQNRAAQRAYRERKEGKLKELSDKLELAEEKRLQLEKELDEIKQRNMLLDLDNQFLQRQQEVGRNPSDSNTNIATHFSNTELTTPNSIDSSTGLLQQHSPVDVISAGKGDFISQTLGWQALQKHHISTQDLDKYNSSIGSSYKHGEEKLLTISAVWDYIMEFCSLNEDVEVNVPMIMDALRGSELCHGFGPAYPLEIVNKAILSSIDSDN